MSTFSRNLNNHWKCREQQENFQTILVIIFWNLRISQSRSNSSQLKQNLISNIAKLVHELPNDLKLMILRKQEILEKLQVMVDTYPTAQFPPSRNQTLVKADMKHAKIDTRLFFSCLSLLYFSILSQIFVQECLIKHIFSPDLAQSTSSSNFFIFSITSEYFSVLQLKNKTSQLR